MNNQSIRPVEFSAKCLSDGFPHTGFPHPWGSYKAQNGALQRILQLPNSQVLNHSLFQFIQSIMIGVQIFSALKEGQLLTIMYTKFNNSFTFVSYQRPGWVVYSNFNSCGSYCNTCRGTLHYSYAVSLKSHKIPPRVW